MIISKLLGGLGNQMFQYAFGRYLAIKHETELGLDLTVYNNLKLQENHTAIRIFELQKVFDIDFQEASQKEIDQYLKPESKIFILQKIRNILNPKYYFKEQYFHFQSEYLNIPDNSYIDGFWQSEKYFKQIETIIRKDFEFKELPDEVNQSWIDKIQQRNSISVHFRRTDYLASHLQSHLSSLPNNYYEKAINYLSDKVKDMHLFVFSDDPKWVSENFNPTVDFDIISNNQGINSNKDMQLMSLCKHNIIANSSFSWWGAWLNKNPNKIVIVPKTWHVKDSKWLNNTIIDERDLIPELWIKI